MQVESRGASMQAAGLSNSPSVQQIALTDFSSARGNMHFGAALAESIGGATAATTGQDPRGRKIDGKRDPKLEPDPSLPAGVPATNVPVTTAILPPILLAAIPLP